MANPSPTTYSLLGMLAVRSWTGYEMTQQLRRSLRYVWPSSEGHLYREQKKLVDLGWATVDEESAGGRTRKRYEITPDGRSALGEWLGTEPEEPHFEIEGILRLFYGDQGTNEELRDALRATASSSRSMLDEMLSYVDEYLEEGGPLWMLEHEVGGPGDRIEFHGRMQYPERLHVVAMVIEMTTDLLAAVAESATAVASEVANWSIATESDRIEAARDRLERIRASHRVLQ